MDPKYLLVSNGIFNIAYVLTSEMSKFLFENIFWIDRIILNLKNTLTDNPMVPHVFCEVT